MDTRDIIVNTFKADGYTSIYYAIGVDPSKPSNCLVVVDEIVMIYNTDYSIDTLGNIEFNNVPSEDSVVAIYIFNSPETRMPTSKDNIKNIIRTVHVGDGLTTSFYINGPSININNYIVSIGGSIYDSSFYRVESNILYFSNPPPKGFIIQIYSFTSNLYNKLTIGGVLQKDNTAEITRTQFTADGIKTIYNIEGASSNKSIYCLVVVNRLLYEGGIDYIVSNNRIKFTHAPTANTLIDVIAFKSTPPQKVDRVRYLNKDYNNNERTLYRNWWREQISHYGTTVNYYLNLATTNNVDKIYGEAPLAGFGEPEEINVIIRMDSESSSLSKFGLITDSESTVYLHHDDFQEVFGKGTEPKIGDVLEFTEIGNDRLNYPKRGPKLMEVTDKLDELSSEINNLAGHYVWYLKLKRFDYSRESSMLPELGTLDPMYTGESISNTPNQIDELSKKIFDYDKNKCSNDRVYGDY